MRGKSSALRAKEEFLALYHDGAFEAGTKIPSESSMAEMLGVSRETWRKALGLLAARACCIPDTARARIFRSRRIALRTTFRS